MLYCGLYNNSRVRVVIGRVSSVECRVFGLEVRNSSMYFVARVSLSRRSRSSVVIIAVVVSVVGVVGVPSRSRYPSGATAIFQD